MSRSDGKFPVYTRLDIDVEEWPQGYYEKARQCEGCGLKWPHPHVFDVSPCCDAKTMLIEDAPDMRWPDAVKALHEARFTRLYEEYNDGVQDDQLDWDGVLSHGELDEKKVEEAINKIEIPEREPYKGIGH